MVIEDASATIDMNIADIESEILGFNEQDAVTCTTTNTTMANFNADINENGHAEESVDIKPVIVNQYDLRDRNSIPRTPKYKKPKTKASNRYSSKANRFKCDQCDYTNAFESRIRVHKQKHSSPKRIACEHCNVRFTYVNNLKTHLKNIHDIIVL